MSNDNDDDDMEMPIATSALDMASMKVGRPTRVIDGKPINEDEAAAARDLLTSGHIVIDPKAEAEMARLGLSKDALISMLLKSVGGHQ